MAEPARLIARAPIGSPPWHPRQLWTARQVPIVEDTPPAPANPQGASKLMVERILADFGPDCGQSHCATATPAVKTLRMHMSPPSANCSLALRQRVQAWHGRGYSVMEVLRAIERESGARLPP
jgi:hypothetical protein